MISRLGPTMAAVALSVGLVLSGCGRSAPEEASGDGGGEPAGAGIRVVSDQTVVPPAPTTVAPATTTTVTTTSPTTAGTYVIQPGDTLSAIAERFGVSVTALSEANGITDVNTIRPGQELNIPAPATG